MLKNIKPILTLLCTALLAPQVQAYALSTPETNAMAILFDEYTQMGQVMFTEDDVRKVAADVQSIKNAFPEVDGISDYFSYAPLYRTAEFNFDKPTAMAILKNHGVKIPKKTRFMPEGIIDVTKDVQSISDFQQIAKLAPFSKVTLKYHFVRSSRKLYSYLEGKIEFDKDVHVPNLEKALGAGLSMRLYRGGSIIGDGDHILRGHQVSDGSLVYVFSVGDGDCIAGCMNHKNYRFKFDSATGQPVKIGEDSERPEFGLNVLNWPP